MKKLIYLTVLIIVFAACGNKSDKANKKAELEKLKKEQMALSEKIKLLEAELSKDNLLQQKVKYVSAVEITPVEFNHFIEVQGKVDGEENLAVNPKAAGVITDIFIKEGDAVKKGQLLASLDDKVYQKTLIELEDSYNFVKDLYNKQKNLWDKKIGSEVQYLSAKNNKESLENKINTIKEQIDMLKITAPISGTIEELGIKIGQAVAPGFPAFRIVNFSKIKVVAEVAEAYSAKIKEGNDVIIYIPDFDKEIKGKISFASKYINPTNRTFTVEVRLNAADFDARANMIAVIKINDYKASNAITIPVNMIQNSMNEQYVFIVHPENSKYKALKKIITVGMTYNGKAEIKSGLISGDKLITVGYQNLNNNELISFSEKTQGAFGTNSAIK